MRLSNETPLEQFLARCQQHRPVLALVLGSGMSSLADSAKKLATLSFQDFLPGTSTSVVGHRGVITLRDWGGMPVLVCEGRLHFYEGHPWSTILTPTDVLHHSGARYFLHTNAAGGIHSALSPGTFMLIREHYHLNYPNSWKSFTPGAPYSIRFREWISSTAREIDLDLFSGSYACLTGPCYETPSEIRALKSLSVDAVGMSTTREVLHAHLMGAECAAISCITNKAAGLSEDSLRHEEVIETANQQKGALQRLLDGIVLRVKRESGRADSNR